MSHTPKPLPQPWHDLAQAFGGNGALAHAMGIHRTTLWRWANLEVMPPAPALVLAGMLFQKAGLGARILPGNVWQIPTEKDLEAQIEAPLSTN